MGKTQKIGYEEMSKKVIDAFVIGADEAFLKKVAKTAKGGGGLINTVGKALTTKDNKYSFLVGAPFFFFMKNKSVDFANNESKEMYSLTPTKDWGKFYAAVQTAIAEELKK